MDLVSVAENAPTNFDDPSLIQIYWTLRGSAVELLDNLSRFPTECWVVQESFNALITRYVKSFEMTQLFLEICPGEVLPKIAYQISKSGGRERISKLDRPWVTNGSFQEKAKNNI